jgi:glycosyltransferase involved in cell wall biosynthesis
MCLIVKKKVLFISLFNNFTGSTKVLSQVINACVKEGLEVEIITSSEVGFLSNIQEVQYRIINYKWSDNKLVLLFNYFKAQIAYFFLLLNRLNKHSNVYINTITPIGAFAACILKSVTPIVHVHEKFVKTTKLHELMEWFMHKTGARKIFVSNYLYNAYDAPTNSVVIYNAVPSPILKYSNSTQVLAPSKIILLIASCRTYKGIAEFVALANKLPDFQFELVLSSNKAEVDLFMNGYQFLHENLKVFPVQTDMSNFYERAGLVMNLSLPHEWIETFGMTILEALSYGKPCIVPNIGGPVELIDDAINGYCVDPQDINFIKEKIKLIFSDAEVYEKMSIKAKEKFNQFDMEIFNKKILKEINSINYA